MSRINETRYIKLHETCKCQWRVDAIVCNDKQRCNMINAEVNVKNWLIKVCVIRDIFGILVLGM